MMLICSITADINFDQLVELCSDRIYFKIGKALLFRRGF